MGRVSPMILPIASAYNEIDTQGNRTNRLIHSEDRKRSEHPNGDNQRVPPISTVEPCPCLNMLRKQRERGIGSPCIMLRLQKPAWSQGGLDHCSWTPAGYGHRIVFWPSLAATCHYSFTITEAGVSLMRRKIVKPDLKTLSCWHLLRTGKEPINNHSN